MSTAVDETMVRRIAKLARLNLSDDEVRQFADQIQDILGYVEQLSEVDIEGVEPMAHALPLTDVARDDAPHDPLPPDLALANAPQREGEFFRVPPVLDGGGGA